MVRLVSILAASALLAVHVCAAPIHLFARANATATQTAANFKQLAYVSTNLLLHIKLTAINRYDDFQISDGVGGDAQAQAEAVFVTPFAGTDLSTISSDVLDAVDAMAKAAETAETKDFDPQIDAASGADADALQVGKIKNKVLKLTGEVQVLNIKVRAPCSGRSRAYIDCRLHLLPDCAS